MNLVIEGKDGQKMAVTNRNMARALATQYSIQADVTIDLSRAWTYQDTKTPTGAGDIFYYLRNQSQRDLIVTRIQGFAPTAETITVVQVTGTPTGGAVLTAQNRVVGSTRQPQQGVEAQAAVQITGLSTANAYEKLHLQAGVAEKLNDLIDRPLVIRPGSAIALQATTGAIAIQYSVDIAEQAIEVSELQ